MTVRILHGDCRDVLKTLPAESVHCCVTSPPYFGLRDYGHDGQIGLEPTPDAFVAELVAVFREVRRVLREDGTLWLNLGDSYASGGRTKRDVGSENKGNAGAAQPFRPTDGAKPKDLLGIPWRVAFALQADGWYLRQDIIWHKPNPMPESVTDRCTKAHEYVFLLSKSGRYFYDAAAIADPAVYAGQTCPVGGRNIAEWEEWSDSEAKTFERRTRPKAPIDVGETRNKRSVWTIATRAFTGAHFATMAPDLAETCIKAGCPEGGTVLDPFGGAGTTGLVADRLQRDAVLIELNPAYADIAQRRIVGDAPLFAEVA
jgi:DNA modification methylase